MKIKYTETYEEYICGVCGYKHMIKYLSHPNRYAIDPGYGKKPFIKSENQFIYQTEFDYSPSRLNKASVYACPECGCIQIDTNI